MTAKLSKPGVPITDSSQVTAGQLWPAQLSLPQAAISIVGLGPGPVESMTLAAWQAIVTAPRLILRTARHPGIAALPPEVSYSTCDDLYESHATFHAVYQEIVARVVAQGREPGGVVYAVPGHPWVGEATTPRILEAAADAGLNTNLIGGMSFVAPCFGAAGIDLMDGSQVIDAMLLAQQHHPRLDPGLPLLVGQIYSRSLASDVKLTLLGAYPDEHPVQLIRAAGSPEQSIQAMPLYELDRQDTFDHLASLYVPPLSHGGSFSHLQEIVAHLRAPDGCPWDREQTLESLKQDLLGECVEVLEAIDLEPAAATENELGDNSEHIGEELGDLLLVATMMIQIATEEGRFRMGDVTRAIVEKLIRRHPHVFGETVVDDVGQVLTNWDAIKAAEKEAKGQPLAGPLDGIPAHLPALEKARRLQSKAEKAGLLKRADLAQSIPEVAAWLERHAASQATGDPGAGAADGKTLALGELLWTLAALAYVEDLNAEDALRAYTVRYRNHRIHRQMN